MVASDLPADVPDTSDAFNTSDASAEPDGAERAELHNGDSSFDGFFADHYEPIARALAVALGDDHFGRDAASEGFAKALVRWSRVETYSNPAGWVYRVGLNWALSRRRKSRRESLDAGSGDERDPSSNIGEHEPGLVPALQSLSIDHRAVVVARYYLDWSELQIAAALDIKPGTVKSRLSRALAQLAVGLGANRPT